MFISGKTSKLTVEDYMLPKEGLRFQLINNESVELPSPTTNHQVILTKIVHIVYDFLESINDKGLLIAGPTDVKFDDCNILHPDIFYISENKKPKLLNEHVEVAPDFIVEIISMASAYYDMRQKKDIYEKHGVKEYIIIDTIGLKAELYALKDGAYNLIQTAVETAKLNSLLFPGMFLDLSKVFSA
jgi:Uma2 family endonuclease